MREVFPGGKKNTSLVVKSKLNTNLSTKHMLVFEQM